MIKKKEKKEKYTLIELLKDLPNMTEIKMSPSAKHCNTHKHVEHSTVMCV